MTRHPDRCRECGSSFGHDEGCSQINAAMVRDSIIAGKYVPAGCRVCGAQYGHHRGCKLEDLSLKPEQESAIRSDPGNLSEFDVECLLHELDRLRTELKESQWLTRKAVNELAALKETHANCETEIHLRALTIQQKNREIAQLVVQLSEANRLWNASLEVQAELEAEIVSLRTMALNLRMERAHE